MSATQTERRYEYVLLDVFTKTRLQGNPLAVFPSAEGITGDEMQRIANELNLSETVFLSAATRPGAIARAQIFTPRRELDFAGHPTIGAAHVLARRHATESPFAIEENVGLVPIESDKDTRGDPRFWLTTPDLTFFETLDAAFCARLLKVAESDVAPNASPQFVSAGSPLLFVALTTPDAVDRAELQQAYLSGALGSVNSTGTFVFARKEPASSTCFDVYARMFAPQTGIAEDPATGGATGPLAAYMLKHGLLPAHRELEFTSEQGTKMGRPSYLHVRVAARGEQLIIKVGGSVVPVAEGTFSL
jgi:trans-2,3-dihydro-3-hydroxyanthranilate isomerase